MGMNLLLMSSTYTSKDLQNYKSLDCYVNFMAGWVREVLVKGFERIELSLER